MCVLERPGPDPETSQKVIDETISEIILVVKLVVSRADQAQVKPCRNAVGSIILVFDSHDVGDEGLPVSTTALVAPANQFVEHLVSFEGR